MKSNVIKSDGAITLSASPTVHNKDNPFQSAGWALYYVPVSSLLINRLSAGAPASQHYHPGAAHSAGVSSGWTHACISLKAHSINWENINAAEHQMLMTSLPLLRYHRILYSLFLQQLLWCNFTLEDDPILQSSSGRTCAKGWSGSAPSWVGWGQESSWKVCLISPAAQTAHKKLHLSPIHLTAIVLLFSLAFHPSLSPFTCLTEPTAQGLIRSLHAVLSLPSPPPSWLTT